jgi:sugar-specific transcriptional regulator TrmB
MKIQSFFDKLGLTQNERSIYLFLLSYGSTIASIVSKRLKIKRVTAYAVLESLSKKNLVSVYERDRVKYFEAASPEELVTICKEKSRQARRLEEMSEKIVSELEKIQREKIKPVLEVTGKIKYYQGLEAVKKLIYETLEEDSKEQLCFGLNKYHTDHLWDDWKEYTRKRATKEMRVRSIQPDIVAAKEYKKRDLEELRETRLVPNKKFPAECELNIIDDMIAIFTSHGNEPTGAKIYNKDMAQVLRSLFELAWEKAGEYDKTMQNAKYS